ncbi:hypothetical protein FHG87_021334 [Trinorchestia longiramus]|nr:hypothetical protein FHG87_021334 [Trinorchestia longiramus]
MIYEARVKDERQKVENIRNKDPDGIKEWYSFIQGNNRSNEVQIHELVVDGCKVSDHGQIVKAVVDFWEDIGGMNEPLIDEEPVTLQIGEYVLKIEEEITSVEIETFLKKVKNGKASGPDDIPYEFYKHSDAEVTRQCCRHDFIKQEDEVENLEYVAPPNPANPPAAMIIKSEVPDGELDDVTVKEEPIEWDQEPQETRVALHIIDVPDKRFIEQ